MLFFFMLTKMKGASLDGESLNSLYFWSQVYLLRTSSPNPAPRRGVEATQRAGNLPQQGGGA